MLEVEAEDLLLLCCLRKLTAVGGEEAKELMEPIVVAS